MLANGPTILGDIQGATSDEANADFMDAGIAVGTAIELATVSTSVSSISPVEAGVFLDGFLIGFLQTVGV